MQHQHHQPRAVAGSSIFQHLPVDIVTGGGQDFVRVYSQQVYGIPPEQVVGTATGTKYGYDKDASGS